MAERVTRRGTIVGVVVALALVAATSFAGRAEAQTPGDGLIPPGDWTDAQVADLLDLIHRTEAALPAKFPTVASFDQLSDVLGGMGYHNFGATAPGGYDHWINNGWLFDDHLVDPDFPEALVYQIQDDGQWHLVSAMFMLDPAIDMDHIPEDIAWLPGWHGHPELCVDDQGGGFRGITDPDMPSCPAGSHSAATPLMMHVWIVDNECGHRFGGVGIEGLHCDVDMGGDHDHMPPDTGGDHDHMPPDTGGDHDHMSDGGGPMAPVAPAATPVAGEPTFTG
jgi:hypothetical protein